jgi:hypothetical protein
VFFPTGTGRSLAPAASTALRSRRKIRLLGGTNLFRLRELPHEKNTRQLHYYFINKKK